MYDNNLINLILLISSLLIILFGVVILIAPNEFNKWAKAMDRVIGLFDVKILSNRILWGIILLISASFLFYTAYSL